MSKYFGLPRQSQKLPPRNDEKCVKPETQTFRFPFSFSIFTHSHPAMTLAEVLITIGIIGVIASITIPSLIKNYQETVLKNQFKKTYSLMQSAIMKIKANNGGFPSCYYGTGGSATSWAECGLLTSELLKNLKVVKTCNSNAYSNGCIPAYKGADTVRVLTEEQLAALNSNCASTKQSAIQNSNSAYVLADGTIIMTYGTNGGVAPIYMFDINGQKLPNKWGYDVFMINLNGGYDSIVINGGGCMPVDTGGQTFLSMLKSALN